MQKLLFSLAIAATGLVVAGCSDLTHPDEIKIIAEPASPAPGAAKPAGAIAPKPGAAVDANGNGDTGTRRIKPPAPDSPKKAADPGACGG